MCAVSYTHLDVYKRQFDGLSVNFARSCEAKVIIRGLRAFTDFEYELQMAQTNRVLATDVDTMFLPTSLQYAYCLLYTSMCIRDRCGKESM